MQNRTSYSELEIVSKEFVQEENYWLSLLHDNSIKSEFIYNNGHLQTEVNKKTYSTKLGDQVCRDIMLETGGSYYKIFTLFASTISILLHKYTNHNKIIIGIPILKQSSADILSNTVVPLITDINANNTFEQQLGIVKNLIVEAYNNQNYPIEILHKKKYGFYNTTKFNLFDVSIVIDNIHNKEYINYLPHNVMFNFSISENKIDLTIEYNSDVYNEENIVSISKNFEELLNSGLQDKENKLAKLDYISKNELNIILNEFNNTRVESEAITSVIDKIRNNVINSPDSIAVVFQNNNLTYRYIDEFSNRICNYIAGIDPKILTSNCIGLLLEPCAELIPVILGIIKAGFTFLPLEIENPVQRLQKIIKDSGVNLIFTQKKFLKKANNLIWSSKSLKVINCIDTLNIEDEIEENENLKMSSDIWDFIGEKATDNITGGGWFSSFTGNPFSEQEMSDYSQNVYKKLKPYLTKNTKVLEIGCASGLTMYNVAPLVGSYYATDISGVIIEKNREYIQKNGIQNIFLDVLYAHEIEKIEAQDFDVIILNSVIQNFKGHNYLRVVLSKLLKIASNKAIIFIGDILDQDKKDHLIQDHINFKNNNKLKSIKTKTDWSEELFVPIDYFRDQYYENEEIENIIPSGKIYTIENELTKYRYDLLIEVNKQVNSGRNIAEKIKHQEDLSYINKQDKCQLVNNHNASLYCIYTSGTTGLPKGVLVSHENILNYTNWFNNFSGVCAADNAICTSSFAFDAVYTQVFSSLFAGGKLHLVKKDTLLSTQVLLNYFIKNQINYLKLTPSFYAILINEPLFKVGTKSIKFIMLGGESINCDLVKEGMSKAPHIKFINHYGPTETTIGISAQYINRDTFDDYIKLPTIGKPIDNSKAYILDKNNDIVPLGVYGQLCFSGNNVAYGYLNSPELTSEKFIKIPFNNEIIYLTGDVARWTSDGNIHFLKRNDNQVKIRGYRIDLLEIKKVINKKYPNVREIVHIKKGEKGVSYLYVYLVSDLDIDVKEFKSEIAKELPSYMIPDHIIKLDEFPLTEHNKINYSALPLIDEVSTNNLVKPVNEVQSIILDIWEEVLGISSLNISTDAVFFDIGGDSLKLLKLVLLINKKLGIRIPLIEIFKHPTIQGISTILNNFEVVSLPKLLHTEKREYYNVAPAQKRLYISQSKLKSSTAFNMPFFFSLKGNLDIHFFEEKLNDLIERHEALRTSFLVVDDVIVQKVHDNCKITIEIIDEHLSFDEAILKTVRPFDLSNSPLIRSGILKKSSNEYFVIIDIHHIATDGLSNVIIAKELQDLFLGNKMLPIKYNYRDYSDFFNKEKKNFSSALNFIERFNLKDIPVIDIPADFTRPVKKNYTGNAIFRKIGKHKKQLIDQFIKRNNSNVFIFYISVFKILLAKLSGKSNIIIGFPAAGRMHPDVDNIIGFFINMLPFSSKISGNETYLKFHEELKEIYFRLLNYQHISLDDIVQQLNVSTPLNRHPVFDYVFDLQNNVAEYSNDLGQATIEPYQPKIKTSKFDLLLAVREDKGEMILKAEYSDELFNEITIDQLLNEYTNIIDEILKNEQCCIEDIQLKHFNVEDDHNTFKEEVGDFEF